jgi:beta-glucosidase
MAVAATEPSATVAPEDLPEGFVLGTATSSYQIEGAATADGRGRSIWDALCARPGAIADGSSGAVACDHYHRWEGDLDLVADLGVDVYRFSIAWPRIQPTGRGRPLEAGLDFYDRLVDGLLERGVTPLPTLYHWDLPVALEDDLGGWRHRDTAGRFADYAAIVGDRLGDRVERWATLNEPWCSAFLGYERGEHAPGVRDEAGSVRAWHHLLLGHGMATQALRSVTGGEVGIVLNLSDIRPATDREGDRAAADAVDVTQNTMWLGPLAGRVPEAVHELVGDLVELDELVRDGDRGVVAEPLDWLGINWYCPTIVRAGGRGERPAGPGLDGIREVPPGPREPGNMLDWHIDADGIVTSLEQAARWHPGTPIVVTENGVPLPDRVGADGGVHDPARVAYLSDHLAAVLRARAGGVPVEGYLAWSLMDNFEWAHGYAPRFGIVHVDYDTLERTPKRSYRWLQELASNR